MKFIRYTAYFIALVVLASYAMVFYVDHQLSRKDYSDSYNDCRKVWSARGLYGNGVEQNSIPSMKAAFSAGAMGAPGTLQCGPVHRTAPVSGNRPGAAASVALGQCGCTAGGVQRQLARWLPVLGLVPAPPALASAH